MLMIPHDATLWFIVFEMVALRVDYVPVLYIVML